MFEDSRKYKIEEIGREELIRILKDYDSTGLESGFSIGEYLLLNDSAGEECIQEYAVFKRDHGTIYNKVESITISVMSKERFSIFLHHLIDRKYYDPVCLRTIDISKIKED
jgi:hypothetical protein